MATPPRLVYVDPATVITGPDPQEFQIVGRCMKSGLRVCFDGVPVDYATVLTSEAATFKAPCSTEAVVLVTVVNPDGKVSNGLQVEIVNAPILRQSEYGPQRTIGAVQPTTPAGYAAVTINPGDNLPSVVSGASSPAIFWIRKGIHLMTAHITPRTGDIYVGEFGAVLDGKNWSSVDDTEGAFRGHNQDIDNVTIRNLVIRNFPQYGIQNYFNDNDGWVIEFCEVCGCKNGINISQGFTVQHNFIHHNIGDPGGAAADRGGGYVGDKCGNSLIYHNEISWNGMEQKIAGFGGGSENVIFRKNWVHDNQADGIWYDTVPSPNALIEDNVCENNGRNSISIEGCPTGPTIIRNNIVRRSGAAGIIVTNSEGCEVQNNQVLDSNRGLSLFVNHASPGEPVTNNFFRSNRVKAPADVVPNIWSIVNVKLVDCSSVSAGAGDDAPYETNANDNAFIGNQYTVPSNTGGNWFWWFLDADPHYQDKTFAQWQLIARDGGTQDDSGSGGSITVG